MREIAEALRQSLSTVSEELKRKRTKKRHDPKKAHHKAYMRRRLAKFQWKNIAEHIPLKKYVEEKLYEDRSPESIARRLKVVEQHLPYTSKNSIYRPLVHGRRLEAYRAKIAPKKKPRRTRVGKLPCRTFRDKRPRIINTRDRVGDVETDCIVSGKTGKRILLTVVCRKLRIAFVEQILSVSIGNVHRAFMKIKKRFLEMRSIATDNDILLQKYKELEKLLGYRSPSATRIIRGRKGAMKMRTE